MSVFVSHKPCLCRAEESPLKPRSIHLNVQKSLNVDCNRWQDDTQAYKKHSFNFSGKRVFGNLSQIVHSNYWITPYYILGRVKITWCSKSYLPAVLSHSYGSYKPNETNIRAMWLFFEVALELGNFPQNCFLTILPKDKMTRTPSNDPQIKL